MRALAVIPVVLFHADLVCPGGFVGVDVFFVISGFLIASLILKELRAGSFSLITFWERRVRRIFPALAVVIFASVIGSWFLYLPQDFVSVGKSVIAQATFVSNFYFWQNTGYFSPAADTKPLLHTWSLAVEEQYYLLFPALLVFVTRSGKTSVSRMIGALSLASFFLSVVWTYFLPATAFYLLPSRAWELLLGAWLAANRGKLPASGLVRESAGWIGVALIGLSIVFFDDNTRFPGLGAVPPCLGAALIIFSSESKLSFVGRILAWRPFVFIGLISYSLYLWHWPILVFANYFATETHSVGFRLLLLAVSFVLSTLSWRYVEIPFRSRRVFHNRSQISVFASVSVAALIGVGFIIWHYQGFSSRFPEKAIVYAESRKHLVFRNELSLASAVDGQFVELGSKDRRQPVSLMVWGDSHAMSITPVLDDLCRRFSLRGLQAAHSDTPPVLDYFLVSRYGLSEDSPIFTDAVLSYVEKNSVRNVVIAARWAKYPNPETLQAGLLLSVQKLIGAGAKVYVLKQVPEPGFDASRLAAFAVKSDTDLRMLGIPPSKYDSLKSGFQTTFEKLAQMGATVLDPSDYFLNENGIYGIVQDDKLLYWDAHHLTSYGSSLLTPLFEPIFREE